jgi:hypothetical protein
MTCRPGHPPRHADFEPGNQHAVVHGLFSARRAEVVAARVDEIAEQVAITYAWTAPYPDERASYARALVDEADAWAFVDSVGVFDDDGRERPAVRTAEKFAARASRARARLGLNPMAAARLMSLISGIVRSHPDRAGAPMTDALDALLAEGRAALERGAQRHQAGEGEP